MVPPPYPQHVVGLLDAPAYVERQLGRIRRCVGVVFLERRSKVDFETDGSLPELFLETLMVVYVRPGASLAAHVHSAVSSSDACRLVLHPWSRFVNHEPGRPELAHGIYLWAGRAWHHFDLPRAA